MNRLHHIYCNVESTLLDVLNIFDKAKSLDLPSGIALVVNAGGQLLGTITDGDIRRALLKNFSLDVVAGEIMEPNPISFTEGHTISKIFEDLPKELRKRTRRSSKYLSKIVVVDRERQPVRILEYHELWEQKIASHRHLVIVGMGYVGLTMAVVMADAGFLVTGVEIDETRYEMLRNGQSYIHEVGLPELLKEQIHKNLYISKEIPSEGDVFIITVGTPIRVGQNEKVPIMDYLLDACEKIGKRMKRGSLVVLRSTVPVGTCRNIVKAKLEAYSGLNCGIDFHLSFAPERTAEGRALKELRSLPQIIGGYDSDSLEATAAIFRDITPTIVKVESLEAAEMAKLINNTFRDYVFAYSNQVTQIASQFNINVFNVIKAANEGYVRDPIPLPSPGVGGPCLTKDPYIFASVAERFDVDCEMFTRSRMINESMHSHIFKQVLDQIKILGKNPLQCNILICGLAFKGSPETGDIRNSTTIEVANLFKGRVKAIYGYDAVAQKSEIEEYGIQPVNIPEGYRGMDVIMFLNNHRSFERLNVYEMVRGLNKNPIIYDGWNLFRHEDILSAAPCVYVGLSFHKSSVGLID